MSDKLLSFFLLFDKLYKNRKEKGRKMKRKSNKSLYLGVGCLLGFALWTFLISFVDVKSIGPNGSEVGFSYLNELVHSLTGVHMWLYTVTDWLGLVPIGVAFGFAILGLVQLIKRRSFFKVDFDILALGGFYLIVMGVYAFFEYTVINYRPVLINGYLEASYPSSTTLLVMTVMPTALMQFRERIKRRLLSRCVSAVIILFILFMVAGRLISGVHWLTDIVGGALLSAGLVMLYYSAVKLKKER